MGSNPKPYIDLPTGFCLFNGWILQRILIEKLSKLHITVINKKFCKTTYIFINHFGYIANLTNIHLFLPIYKSQYTKSKISLKYPQNLITDQLKYTTIQSSIMIFKIKWKRSQRTDKQTKSRRQ